MSKRVSIVLPEEMPSAPSIKKKPPKQSPTMKSAIKSTASVQRDLVPPVFVVVSPQTSQSSMSSGQQISISSLTNPVKDVSGSGEGTSSIEAVPSPESGALVHTGSTTNSQQTANYESASTSIKQFLRSTVALVRAGESFTSVKRLFHKFIKNSSGSNSNLSTSHDSSNSSQGIRKDNPYLSRSNDTLLSDLPPQLTIPSTSQMTTSIRNSNYSFNNAIYDRTSLLSDSVTPLTGYTAKTEEAGYRTDASIQTASKSLGQDLASLSELPSGSGQAGSRSPGQVRSRTSSRSVRKKRRTSVPSSSRKSPKMSPRRDHDSPAVEPVFALVSSSGPNSEQERSSRSRRRSSQGSGGASPKITARVSVSSVSKPGLDKSGGGQSPRSVLSKTSSRRSSRSGSRASASKIPEYKQQKSDVDYAFALVSPQEEEVGEQPVESSAGEVEDGLTSCRTYQEHCKCHHCQDMRRALKRADFFQSPEGQKRLETKLLAKNFFMDLCALAEVRSQVRANLLGIRRHPSARLSYPVSICGASRLDGGALSLQWFTHDLDNVDHFDFFVDNKPNRSVYNLRANGTVLLDVNAAETHTLRMRAVPRRSSSGQDALVEQFMAEVAAGHMRHVRQGQLFARCLKHLDAQPQQRTLVDFWTDSEFLYLPTPSR
ncbi:uncharacterized protein LOC128255367 [Drosophila gunungcola]|uniref:Uncharacterized protein n=1 Tax=Drosophila gunungcola TaxID=103775 RepID=A0A9P9YIV8_9MUSC|nr:uncharacterized protein LOC128255367 [Drosophila gunungcola]KAI8037424.1 hypothetical protein M5D96_009561 [Drosophila gunungcola]